MSHETEIVDVVRRSDNEFEILIRCCEPCDKCKGKSEINRQCKDCHLHPHPMHSSVVNDTQKLQNSIMGARNLAAENHQASLRARKILEGLKGSRMQHDNGNG